MIKQVMKVAMILFLFLFIYSCVGKKKQSEEIKTAQEMGSVQLLDSFASRSDRSINEDLTDELSVELDTILLPVDEDTEIDILLPAGYRYCQPTDFHHMNSEPWYDFYQDATAGFCMNRANIKVANFYDDCIGDSVVSVSSDRDNSLLFIKGIIPPDSIIETKPIQDSIYMGEQYEFDFHGRKYKLRAEGVSTKDTETYVNWDNVKNYKLYLSESELDNEQLLIAMPEFQDTYVAIIWMGDMDMDGRPDFLFDVSDNYEAKSVVLFLSSKSDNGKLVKCVGRSEYVFDC